MYARVFTAVFEGSMRGKPDLLLVWFNILAHSPGGVCDRTPQTMADEIGLPLERVKAALIELESPDPQSRSPEAEGRRIIRVSDHRDWGWKLVNWDYYRSLISQADKREKDADRQRAWRKANKPTTSHGMSQTDCDDARGGVTLASASDSECTRGGTEGDTSADRGDGVLALKIEENQKPQKSNSELSDEQWLEGLKTDPAYKDIDVARELAKMTRWCKEHKKRTGRKRFISWLNRVDAPLSTPSTLPENLRTWQS